MELGTGDGANLDEVSSEASLDQSYEVRPETGVAVEIKPLLPKTLVPHAPNQPSAKDVQEPMKKQLPHSLTRGIPKPMYEPNPSSKA